MTDRKQFVAQMARELPQLNVAQVIRLCNDLMRHSTFLHRLAEAACNRELTPREDRQGNRIKQLDTQLCEPHKGLEPIFNSDPRGPSILLRLPSGYTDDWGQRGFCVPVGKHA